MHTLAHRYARGQIVLIALVFFGVFVGVTSAAISLLVGAQSAERVRVARAEALALAEAGVDEAVYELNHNGGYAGDTLTLGAGSVTTSVTTVDSATKRIISTGTVSGNTSASRTIEAEVNIDTTVVSFNFGVQVGKGGLLMDNNSEVNGNIFSDGDISGGGTINGDTTVAAGSASTPDQSWSVQNGDAPLGDTSGHADLAQGFVPASTAVLNSVSLNLKKVGSPGDITIKIVSDNGGKPSKTVLGSGTLSASGVTGSYGFVTATLSSTPSLTAGQTYWVIAIASVSASNYFVWGSDTSDAYTGGTGKSSSNWNSGNPVWTALNADLGFAVYMGGVDTTLSGVTVTGDAWAHTLEDCSVGGDASYQTINSCSVGGTEHPGTADAAPVALPITDAQITDWEATAASANTITGPYTVSTPQTLGPTKIAGNLAINGALTIAGPIWVEGNVTFGNGASMTVASSVGNNGVVLVADTPANRATGGTIALDQGATFSGNGGSGSYPMLLSTNTGGSAITLNQNASGAIVYASSGTVLVNQNATANQITAYRLHLQENAIVNYINGLADQSFSNGPGGSWTFVPGSYGIRP